MMKPMYTLVALLVGLTFGAAVIDAAQAQDQTAAAACTGNAEAKVNCLIQKFDALSVKFDALTAKARIQTTDLTSCMGVLNHTIPGTGDFWPVVMVPCIDTGQYQYWKLIPR
jgi:hypothetical protein